MSGKMMLQRSNKTADAAPSLIAAAYATEFTAATTMTINIPQNSSGDMLILVMTQYTTANEYWEAGNGWTILPNTNFGYAYQWTRCFYKKGTGATTDTVTKRNRSTVASVHVIKSGTYKEPLDYAFSYATGSRNPPIVGPTPLTATRNSVITYLLEYDASSVNAWPYPDGHSSIVIDSNTMNAACFDVYTGANSVDPVEWVCPGSAAATNVFSLMFGGN